MSLVTLDNTKIYLGIPLVDTTDDVWLQQQIDLISGMIEDYCGRKFNSNNYTQTWYKDDFDQVKDRLDLYTYHYPMVSVTSVKEIVKDADNNDVETLLDASEYRFTTSTGKFKKLYCGYNRAWFSEYEQSMRIEVVYDAGYAQADIPIPLQQTTYSLIEERYSKYKAGIDLNFGNDLQRISIPGVASFDFDYSLQANERKAKYGMILGNYLNMIDPFRSERDLVGDIVGESHVS